MKQVLLAVGLMAAGVAARAETDLAQYVDPMLGTAEHGHTIPGACVPFGMIQLSPDNGTEGWDWCSGYNYSSDEIAGFSHTHLSGTGCFDLADISVMPTVLELGKKDFVAGAHHAKALVSKFSHAKEGASPGYYHVHLDGPDVEVELTASQRAGYHRYTFPAGKVKTLVFDLGFTIGDKNLETGVRQIAPDTILGWRHSKGWAKYQKVFFVARFSEPIGSFKTYLGKPEGDFVKGKEVKAVLTFPAEARVLCAQVALSSADLDGAQKNLAAEPTAKFDEVRAATRAAWNQQLAKIEVEGNGDWKKTFYTALYHSFVAPCTFSDVDGRYKGYKHETVKAEGYTQVTVLSLWDTFRALMPLFVLTNPEMTRNTICSGLAQFDQTGQLPIWELVGNETGCMIGYHCVPVICEAIRKGIGGFDIEHAYTAMKAAAEGNTRGLPDYRAHGVIPCEKEKESVSKLLEYCYDDWCIAQVAAKLGKTGDAAELLKRSKNFHNVFDASTGFFRPRKSDGSWLAPFDPKLAGYGETGFTEGNAWQWNWFVLHDPNALIEMLGGPEKFVKRLDQLFLESAIVKSAGRTVVDMTGMVGQDCQGNEPSHHVVYLYNSAGRPDRTRVMARTLCTTLYTSKADGLCGNDDCGQMSAWYVFNALGFYPLNPAGGRYELGAPMFDRAVWHLPNGKTFTIVGTNDPAKNAGVKTISLNGQPLDRLYITYEEIMAGGELRFEMAPAAMPSVKSVDPKLMLYDLRFE